METALIVVLAIVFPIVLFFLAIGTVIGTEWLLNRSTHFSIRDLLIATTVVALILGLAVALIRR